MMPTNRSHTHASTAAFVVACLAGSLHVQTASGQNDDTAQIMIEVRFVQLPAIPGAQAEPVDPPGSLDTAVLSREAFEARMAEYVREDHAQLLSAPRLLALDGQKAAVTLSAPIPYLVRNDNGCLVLEESTDIAEGLSLELRPGITPEGHIEVTIDRAELTRLTGRETLEGIPLDVGKPIVQTIATTGHFTIRDDHAIAVTFPTTPGEDRLIMYFLAKLVDGAPSE